MTHRQHALKLIEGIVLSTMLLKPLYGFTANGELESAPPCNIGAVTVVAPREPILPAGNETLHQPSKLTGQDLIVSKSEVDQIQFAELSDKELNTVRGGFPVKVVIPIVKNTLSIASSTSSLTSKVIKKAEVASITASTASTAGSILKSFDTKIAPKIGNPLSLGGNGFTIAQAVIAPNSKNIADATVAGLSAFGTIAGSTAASIVASQASLALGTSQAITDVYKVAGQLSPSLKVITQSTPSMTTTSMSIGQAAVGNVSKGASVTAGLISSQNNSPRAIQQNNLPTLQPTPTLLTYTPPGTSDVFLCAGNCAGLTSAQFAAGVSMNPGASIKR